MTSQCQQNNLQKNWPRCSRGAGAFGPHLLLSHSLFVTPRAFLNRRGTESLGPPPSNLAGSIINDDRPGRFGRRVGCCCTRGVRASLGAAEGQSARIAGFELPCLPTWIRVRGNLATCMHGVWGAGFYEGGALSWSWAACVRDFLDLKCRRAHLLGAGGGCKHARIPHLGRAPGRGVALDRGLRGRNRAGRRGVGFPFFLCCWG